MADYELDDAAMELREVCEQHGITTRLHPPTYSADMKSHGVRGYDAECDAVLRVLQLRYDITVYETGKGDDSWTAAHLWGTERHQFYTTVRDATKFGAVAALAGRLQSLHA